jgi:tetratricopeptide (TPR) repeat protein
MDAMGRAVWSRAGAAFLLGLPFLGCVTGPSGSVSPPPSAATAVRPSAADGTTNPRAYEYFCRAKLALEDNDLPGAIEDFKTAIVYDHDSTYLYTELARTYYRAGDSRHTEESARKAIAIDPKALEARMLLAQVYADNKAAGSMERAEAEYKAILAVDPSYEDAYLYLGKLYADAGQEAKAEEILQSLVKRDPDAVIADYYLGLLAAQDKKNDEAERWLKEAVARRPGFVKALNSLATLYQATGRLDDAIKIYDGLLQDQPRNFYVHRQLGELYNQKEEPEQALAEFLAYLEYDDQNSAVRQQVGLLYLQLERAPEASATFQEMLAGDPKNWLDHFFLGFSLEAAGKNADAIAEYAKIPKTPDSDVYVRARIRMALVYVDQNQVPKAEAALREGLSQAPGDSSLTATLGDILCDDDHGSDAVELLTGALKSKPDDEQLLYGLGTTYGKLGRTEESVAQMRHVLELDPEHADAMNYIGYTLAEKGGDLVEAERLVRKALEIKPDNGFITDSLGWVLYQKGSLDEAIKTLEHALSLAPDEPIILEHLGDAFLKAHDVDQALAQYEKALSVKETTHVALDADASRLKGKIRDVKVQLSKQ